MAWNTPKTWAVGEMLTAELMNEQMRDNLSSLQTSARRLVVDRNDNTYERTSANSTYTDIETSTNDKLQYTFTPTTGVIALLLGSPNIRCNGSGEVSMSLAFNPGGGDTLFAHLNTPDTVASALGSVMAIIPVTPNTSYTFTMRWAYGTAGHVATLTLEKPQVLIMDVGVPT